MQEECQRFDLMDSKYKQIEEETFKARGRLIKLGFLEMED